MYILFLLLTGILFFTFAQPLIVIKDAWIRAVPPSSKNTALFMIIENKGDEEDTLISVKTDIAKMSMIHKTENKNGVMKMVHIKKLKIPPKSKVILKPGGLHIMLMGLKRPLKIGEKENVLLEFQKTGKIEIQVPVLLK